MKDSSERSSDKRLTTDEVVAAGARPRQQATDASHTRQRNEKSRAGRGSQTRAKRN